MLRWLAFVRDMDIGADGLGFDSCAGQVGHCRQWLTTVVKFLCSPGAKPLRWASPLVTSFGVLPRVAYNEDLNFLISVTVIQPIAKIEALRGNDQIYDQCF